MLCTFEYLSYEMYLILTWRLTEIDKWKKWMVLPYLFIEYIPCNFIEYGNDFIATVPDIVA